MTNESPKKSPWNELDYYKEGQPIYGRDEEIWKVTNGICQNLQTMIYGRSGIGKSSLLFAGVFPQLRKEMYFPIFIRLGIPSKKPYNDRIIDEVLEEAARTDTNIGKGPISHKTTIQLEQPSDEGDAWKLWNFFSTTQFTDIEGQPYIPVLVFDQFEEILNNSETHNEAEHFLLDLYSLIDDTRFRPEGCIPYSNFRVVFSLREDYLYCLEDIIDKYNLNELRFNRYRIAAMSDKNARIVIMRTSMDAGGCLEKDKEQLICDKIIEESKSNNYLGEISTLMLSLICSIQYCNASDGVIKYEHLGNNAAYLYNYYSSKMSVVEYKTQEYLEDKLITSDGRRNSIDLQDAKDSGKVSDDAIKALIDTRIIRLVSSGGNNQRIEFVHDTLTKVIQKKKKTLWQCFTHACKNINNYSGHADRKEWIASFLPIIITIVGFYIHKTLGLPVDSSKWLYYYVFLFGIIICAPTSIRRCHDFGKSGWKVFLYLFALPFKSSSPQLYKSTSSGITWRRMIIQKSLTHIEYRTLSARLLTSAIMATLVVIPLFDFDFGRSLIQFFMKTLDLEFNVTNLFDNNKILIKAGLLFFISSVCIPLVNGYCVLFLMRLSSTNLPLVSAFIPGFNLFLMIRLAFPYKNESTKITKNARLLLYSIIFLPIWILAIALPFFNPSSLPHLSLP